MTHTHKFIRTFHHTLLHITPDSLQPRLLPLPLILPILIGPQIGLPPQRGQIDLTPGWVLQKLPDIIIVPLLNNPISIRGVVMVAIERRLQIMLRVDCFLLH